MFDRVFPENQISGIWVGYPKINVNFKNINDWKSLLKPAGMLPWIFSTFILYVI
jgi:hypothetical protein